MRKWKISKKKLSRRNRELKKRQAIAMEQDTNRRTMTEQETTVETGLKADKDIEEMELIKCNIEKENGGETEMKNENRCEAMQVPECKIYHMTGREGSRKRRAQNGYTRGDLRYKAISECMAGRVQTGLGSVSTDEKKISYTKRRPAKQIPFPVNGRTGRTSRTSVLPGGSNETNVVLIQEKVHIYPVETGLLTNVLLNYGNVSGLDTNMGKIPYSVLDYGNIQLQNMERNKERNIEQNIGQNIGQKLGHSARQSTQQNPQGFHSGQVSESIRSCKIVTNSSNFQDCQDTRNYRKILSVLVNQAQKGREEISFMTRGRRNLRGWRRLRYRLGSAWMFIGQWRLCAYSCIQKVDTG